MRALSRWAPLGSLVALLLSPRPASGGDQALAEVLFRDGKKLMNERRFAEACPKLAESQRLDPAGGTLTTLALCHEAEGKTATAWAEFGEVLAGARRDGRADRETVAKDHLAALEPKLARLVVTVSPTTSQLDGVEIKRDGATLGRPAWGVPSPIDPGAHAIEAGAPGRRPWKTTVMVANGETKSVTIEALDPVGEAALPAAPREAPPRRSPTLAYALGAGGVVALGVGAVFGLQAISKAKSANDKCPASACADAGARSDSEAARRASTIADVGVGVGIVLVGVSAYLLLSSSGTEEKTARMPIGVSVGRDGVGATLKGAW